MQQINTEITESWDSLSLEGKKVFLLLSSALKHVSDEKDTSTEVLELEKELNRM